jgi:uncharacterized protein YkwD
MVLSYVAMRALTVAALLLSACVLEARSARGAPDLPPYDEELQRCVELVNQYRATIKHTPLKRSAALEAFAAKAAANDGVAHVGHQYFRRTNGGGVSLAENSIPWWPMASVGGVRGALEQGLQMMWDEGPSGGHYQNMVERRSEIGCGIFVNRGEVTIVQEFR